MADIHPICHMLPEAGQKARKPDALRRSKRIPILVTAAEYDLLHAMAMERRCPMSDLLRAAVQRIPPHPIDQKVIAEMANLTAKLTALLRDAHRYPDRAQLISLITSIQVLFEEIFKRLL